MASKPAWLLVDRLVFNDPWQLMIELLSQVIRRQTRLTGRSLAPVPLATALQSTVINNATPEFLFTIQEVTAVSMDGAFTVAVPV